MAMDMDLVKNKPIGFDSVSQNVSLGAEFNILDYLQLRAGYRYNMSNSKTNAAAIGVGLSPKVVRMDLAVEGSDREVGVGFQLGFHL